MKFEKTDLMRAGLTAVTSVVNAGRTLATPERRGTHDHRTVIPEATYSPWRVDDEFQIALGLVREHTLVDEFRLYELWSLAGQMQSVPGDYLEVGVWRGGSAALVARQLERSCSDARRVVLCDTFTGVALAGKNDASYRGGEHADTSVAVVETLFETAGLAAPEIHSGIFPQEVLDDLTSTQFCLVHIDVDVYESALEATRAAWSNLSAGGVVVFDDYGFVKTQGVRRAVEELAVELPDALLVQNLNGHGLLVKSVS